MRTIIWLKVTKVVDEYWLLLQSLPSLGEWIEMFNKSISHKESSRLSLRWESGLKCLTKMLAVRGKRLSLRWESGLKLSALVRLTKQECLSLRWESGLKYY